LLSDSADSLVPHQITAGMALCPIMAEMGRSTMKREIKEVEPAKGIMRVTTQDERFYARRILRDTPDERWDFVPSVTWISSFYPKGIGFYKWLANHGWDEAEEIRIAAGDKGSKVHQAIGLLLNGGTVEMEAAFENPRTLELEPLTAEEYFCLMTFAEWFAGTKPEVIDFEYTVWNEHFRYAGTVDLKCRLNIDQYKHVWIIDVKTSSEIWPPMELQVSAYKHADLPKADKTAILQVGYKRNKTKKYKFTPISDKFQLFLAARRIWTAECADVKPLQREYPLSLSLNNKEPI
jgi:hypothetical protein